MLDLIGVSGPLKTIIYLLIAFAFFIGVVLMISPEAYSELNKALMKEYGVKKKLVPKVESWQVDLDKILLKFRIFVGAVMVVSAFILLMFY